MIEKNRTEVESRGNFLEKQKRLKKSASVDNFSSISVDEMHKCTLKSLKSQKQQKRNLDKKNTYFQKFFKPNDLPPYNIEDYGLSKEYDSPQLQRFYEEIESKRRYNKVLTVFRDKAYKKIKSYSENSTKRKSTTQYFKESFISQIGTYQEKYRKCSIAYNSFTKNLNSSIKTRDEFLSLTLDLINELNYPVGWSCTTGFDLVDKSLKEAKLPKLTSEEKNSINQGIIPNDEDEDDYFHPIIT